MFYKTEYFMIFNCILYFYRALAVLQVSNLTLWETEFDGANNKLFHT